MHPLALVAITVLALNDQVWKHTYSNWWTGKVSDFAGMVFFPLLLSSVLEWSWWCFKKRPAPECATLICVGLTGFVFAAINLSAAAGEIYQAVWGSLYALLPGPDRAMTHTQDVTDLLALPALCAPGWIATRLRTVRPQQSARMI